MKVVTEAKTKEEALDKALKELNLNQEDIIFKEEKVKGKLFKADTIKLTVYSKEDIINNMKNFIKETVNNLGIDVNFESNIRENQFYIRMFSNNNAILIGKNGRTMKAIEMLTKQKVATDYDLRVKLFLDVENYNDKRVKQLERLAVNTAKEVVKTKIEATLDNMNSYERRIVHNKLAEFKGVTTISEGEEPTRHIIIRPE